MQAGPQPQIPAGQAAPAAIPLPTLQQKQRAAAIIVALSRQAEIHGDANARLPFPAIAPNFPANNDVGNNDANGWGWLYKLIAGSTPLDNPDPKVAIAGARALLTGNLPDGTNNWKFNQRIAGADLAAAARTAIIDAFLPAIDPAHPLPASRAGIDPFVVRLHPEAAVVFNAIAAAHPDIDEDKRNTLLNQLIGINFKHDSAPAAVKHAIEAVFPAPRAGAVAGAINLHDELPRLLNLGSIAQAQTQAQDAQTTAAVAGAAEPPAVTDLKTRCENIQIARALIEKLQLIAASEGLQLLSPTEIATLRDSLLTLNLAGTSAESVRPAVTTFLHTHHEFDSLLDSNEPQKSPLFQRLNLSPTLANPLADPLNDLDAQKRIIHFVPPQSTLESMQIATSFVQLIRTYAENHGFPPAIINDAAGWEKLAEQLAKNPTKLTSAEETWKLIQDNLPGGGLHLGQNFWMGQKRQTLATWLGLPPPTGQGQAAAAAAAPYQTEPNKQEFLQRKLTGEESSKQAMADNICKIIEAYAKTFHLSVGSTNFYLQLHPALMEEIVPAQGGGQAAKTLLTCTAAELQDFIKKRLTHASWAKNSHHLDDSGLFAWLKIRTTDNFPTDRKVQFDTCSLDAKLHVAFTRWARSFGYAKELKQGSYTDQTLLAQIQKGHAADPAGIKLDTVPQPAQGQPLSPEQKRTLLDLFHRKAVEREWQSVKQRDASSYLTKSFRDNVFVPQHGLSEIVRDKDKSTITRRDPSTLTKTEQKEEDTRFLRDVTAELDALKKMGKEYIDLKELAGTLSGKPMLLIGIVRQVLNKGFKLTHDTEQTLQRGTLQDDQTANTVTERYALKENMPAHTSLLAAAQIVQKKHYREDRVHTLGTGAAAAAQPVVAPEPSHIRPLFSR
ncbi:MAG: hypothetical protein A2X77_03120 [Gammaproteobacteria bacterium GWE2_42_36]|nr:MAG: hypothetical protein A2X77_03120 [Gammaproteobacteria bacterium GWE2_42_36]HCU04836.1 hypothetical protein [Coxiellaceae bacterium]